MGAVVCRGVEGKKKGRQIPAFLLPELKRNPLLSEKDLAKLRKKSFKERFIFMDHLQKKRGKK